MSRGISWLGWLDRLTNMGPEYIPTRQPSYTGAAWMLSGKDRSGGFWLDVTTPHDSPKRRLRWVYPRSIWLQTP